MQNTSEIRRFSSRPNVLNSARRCHECDKEALGRCPDCHQGFCEDHFPKNQHSPCAERQMKMAQTQVCYVCGTQVYPDQWSVSRTTHFIDQFKCAGCNRHICDELHTKSKAERVEIEREGLRGHRYQYTMRYCDTCAPLARVGGIKGLARLAVVVGTIALTVFLYLHR